MSLISPIPIQLSHMKAKHKGMCDKCIKSDISALQKLHIPVRAFVWMQDEPDSEKSKENLLSLFRLIYRQRAGISQLLSGWLFLREFCLLVLSVSLP